MDADRTNVVYVAEFTTGGSVVALHNLVAGLDRQRYAATVLFYREPDAEIRRDFEEADASVIILFPGKSGARASGGSRGRNMQQRIRKLFGRHVESLYASLKYIYTFLRYKLPTYRALRRQFSTLPVDIVHLNNGLASDMPGILAGARCKLPVVCHVRAFSIHTPVHAWASRFVSVFLCVSNAIREHVIAAGVDPARTAVCYDCVDQRRFQRSAVEREAILSEFGWDAADKAFGIIGRLDSWKGHETFIDAIGIARKSEPAVRGLIVGAITPTATNQAYVDSLRKQVRKLELDAAVTFAGHRTNIPEINQSLDGVICASSSPEPFGLMVVESMAVGTPVIATNAGGPAEMITDGVDGLLVPLKDAAAMADAMLRVAREPDLAENLAAAGLNTVAERFTVARHVNNVCNVYEALHRLD